MMTSPYALILEDDPRLGSIAVASLKAIGCETDIDPDGNRYPQMLEMRRPDVVLLDMHLPFALGSDVFYDLRNDPRWQNIPIIIMTADLHLAKAFEGRAEHVLVKPVSVTRLQETVRNLLATQ